MKILDSQNLSGIFLKLIRINMHFFAWNEITYGYFHYFCTENQETSRETPPPHPIGKESSEIIAQEGAKDEERDQMLADPDHPCITSPLQIINILEQTAMEK